MDEIYGNPTTTPMNPDMFGTGGIPISKAVKIDRITPMLPTGLYVLESSAIMVETEETSIDKESYWVETGEMLQITPFCNEHETMMTTESGKPIFYITIDLSQEGANAYPYADTGFYAVLDIDHLNYIVLQKATKEIARPYVSLMLAENTADNESNFTQVFYVYIARPWQATPYKGSKFDSYLSIVGSADYINLGLGCRNIVDLVMHYNGTKNIPTLTVEERADDFRKIKAGVELELIGGGKKLVIGDRYGIGVYENNNNYNLASMEVFTPDDDAPYCATNKLYVDTAIGSIETALDSIIAIQNQLIGGGE